MLAWASSRLRKRAPSPLAKECARPCHLPSFPPRPCCWPAWPCSLPAQANLSQQQSAAIIKAYDGSNPADFKQFLGKLAGSDLAKADKLDATLKTYLAGKPLNAEQQDEINRLLGLYTRIKYGKAATETLRELVAIPTVRKEGVLQHENPEFLKIADKIKALAEGFGLQFRNIDNRVYEITLGEGKEVIGIHAHADVVPVNPDNWKLKDGTKLDPFKVTLVGDRMYGRGTEDDKNGIVVALYALKVAKDEKLPWRANSSCWWTPPRKPLATPSPTTSNATPPLTTTWRWTAAIRW